MTPMKSNPIKSFDDVIENIDEIELFRCLQDFHNWADNSISVGNGVEHFQKWAIKKNFVNYFQSF